MELLSDCGGKNQLNPETPPGGLKYGPKNRTRCVKKGRVYYKQSKTRVFLPRTKSLSFPDWLNHNCVIENKSFACVHFSRLQKDL